ncbi:hypothetical protein OIU34_20710 [Pararhizobium sp. BT-229]|uniref:hypothetical protein n=1 Tax=Pararhizobium sp. BT-229 TaxID=2986923 RepID=UPI0021F6C342|nr:hypothetical protein [Pararhizobium sp. BT-229]MCV9964312.1 hypothetical protein [Pararhizobium sp. BT-229]
MSGFLVLFFIAIAFYLCYPSRRYKPGKTIRGADYFHSSGYSGRSYYNPGILKGARWWKR